MVVLVIVVVVVEVTAASFHAQILVDDRVHGDICHLSFRPLSKTKTTSSCSLVMIVAVVVVVVVVVIVVVVVVQHLCSTSIEVGKKSARNSKWKENRITFRAKSVREPKKSYRPESLSPHPRDTFVCV